MVAAPGSPCDQEATSENMTDQDLSTPAGGLSSSPARAPEADAQLDRVVETERLKAAFLASLSHEFRTPLNVVLGYLDLLEEAPTGEEACKLRALIRRHTASMLAMLDNTLYLADLRLERVVLAPEVIALAPLLEGAAREAEVLWGRPAVPLRLDLDAAIAEVRTDKRALRQIVKNLLANALCFTEAGDVLLRARAVPALDLVEIDVADNGPGIPPLECDRIFDEYAALRTDRPGHYNAGLGIGLPVAKRLATLLGGSLEIESADGWSSIFRFRLPTGVSASARNQRRTTPMHGQAEGPAARVGSSHPVAVRGKTRCAPFPAILGVIARALGDPFGDDRDVRRAVRSDEVLSLTLLNYANSASFARARPAESIDDALGIVGLTGLRSIVLTKFIHSLFTRWGCAEEFLWEHALASALAASRLHAMRGHNADELYLCGLLHNLGKVMLNAEDPIRYADVLRCVSEAGEEFCDAEETVFGVSHPVLGGELVRNAGIPDIVRSVVAHHHDPAVADPTLREICRNVLVADAIAYTVSPAWAALQGTSGDPSWIARRIENASGGFAPETLAAVIESVRVELQDMRQLLRR